jgi:hypothetical protein
MDLVKPHIVNYGLYDEKTNSIGVRMGEPQTKREVRMVVRHNRKALGRCIAILPIWQGHELEQWVVNPDGQIIPVIQ